MPLYRVTLQRTFEVEIDAQNENIASQLVGLYLGYCDDADDNDKVKNRFVIHSINMLENEVIEITKP